MTREARMLPKTVRVNAMVKVSVPPSMAEVYKPI